MAARHRLACGQLAHRKENLGQVFLERIFGLLASHQISSPEQIETLLWTGLAASQGGQFCIGRSCTNECAGRGSGIVVNQEPESLFQSLTGILQIVFLECLTETLP